MQGGPIQVGYLVDSQFAHIDGKWDDFPAAQQGKISDWEVDSRAGVLTCYMWNVLLINDQSTTGAIQMRKSFLPQRSGTISVEFRFLLPNKVDGMVWSVRADRDNALMTITTSNGDLGYLNASNQFVTLIAGYYNGRAYTVHADINLSDMSLSTLSIDGVRKVTGAGFFQNTTLGQAGQFYIGTPVATTGSMQMSYVTITKGYKLFERFTNATVNLVPADWTATSGNLVATAMGSNPKDRASFKLGTANANLSRSFASTAGKLVFEYKFMLPEKIDGVKAQLGTGSTSAVTIATASGGLVYINGSGVAVSLWPNYKANVWYTIRLVANPASQKTDIYINGKLKGSQIPFAASVSAFDKVTFGAAATAKPYWVDDIYVYDFQPAAADYVPAVQPIAGLGYMVGMQTFFAGWRDGQHVGWDWIYRHPNHDPYMGFSDGGNTENMDWQLKWMAEAGVNFFLDCWYKNTDTVGYPMKEPMSEYTEGPIHNGYFYAKYSDKVKFAIADYTLEETSAENFTKYILPYWIEYYFKDPRYLIIPGAHKGSPVVSLGKATDWVNLSDDQMKDSITALRTALAAEGYDGVFVLAVYSGADVAVMNKLYAAGVDYCYAYWGTQVISTTQSRLIAQRDANTNLLPIADAGMGMGGEAWDLVAPFIGYTSLADFATISEWMRDDFLPSAKFAGTLSEAMVLYDNWNEFGEGHYICPTNLEGFGYTSAIRDAFTSSSIVDVKPNATQRARMNVLYTRAWDGRSWGFDSLYPDTEGWTVNSQISSMAQNKGFLEGIFSGSDPSIISRDGYAIDASLNKTIKVRLKNATSGTAAAFYFITDTDATYNAAKMKTFPITPNSTDYQEYIVDMSAVANWTGKIRQLRFDPVEVGAAAGGAFSIDSIKIVSDGRSWEFNSPDAGAEGWAVKVQINALTLNAGYLEGAIAGTDPSLLSPDELGIDASTYKKIKVRMKNGTSGTAGKFYFTTNADGVYNESKAKVFALTSSDPGYTEYTVDMTALPTWTGTIRRFRYDPVDAGASSGPVSIDYIRVVP